MSDLTVYLTIGNTDDKLTQAEWAKFIGDVNASLILAKMDGGTVQFAGHSFPDAPWQNALWCIQIPDDTAADALKTRMAQLARRHRQDSIAWAQVDKVDMVTPPPAGGGPW